MRRAIAIVITAAAFLAPASVLAQDVVLRLIYKSYSHGSSVSVEALRGSASDMEQTVRDRGYQAANLQDSVATWLQTNHQKSGRTIHLAIPTVRPTAGWEIERNGGVLCMRAPSGASAQVMTGAAFLISSTRSRLVWTNNANQNCGDDERAK